MHKIQTRVLPETILGIEEASSIIKNGGLVAFQTETVYGIGANALDPNAVKKIFKAKGRPQDNPVIVHVCNMTQLNTVAVDIPECVNTLKDVFWPGPLTLVLKKSNLVPDEITAGLQSVAVRIPQSEVALSLIEKSGVPIAAPSANISGKPSPTTLEHVISDMTGRVDAIIEGGSCEVGIESTVLDLTNEKPVILRLGKITREDIEKALDVEVNYSNHILNQRTMFKNNPYGLDMKKTEESGDNIPSSPGVKYRHYAPNAKMFIYCGAPEAIKKAIEDERSRLVSEGQKVGVLYYGESLDQKTLEFAIHDFFNRLRIMDKDRVDTILAGAVNNDGLGLSLMDRMVKASGYNIVHV